MLANEKSLEEKMRIFAELEKNLPMFFRQKEVYLNTDVDLIRDYLMLDKRIFDALYVRDPELIIYLLPWTYNSKIIERKNFIKIRFPLD
jgi:hypothetical protein